MARRLSTAHSIPPSIEPRRAIELLKRQLSLLDGVIRLHHDDPKISAWASTTENILDAAFGRPNGEKDRRTHDFERACDHVSYGGMPDSEYQAYHVEGHKLRGELLRAYIDQLEILAPPNAVVSRDEYQFHPEIEKVSGQLFTDGHYREAALNAYIRVIEEVKHRSGLIQEDGDSLMNRAFGAQNQAPVLRFNALQTESERDEQKGLMFLFKGIVGLRNSKAHSTRLFNDSQRARDYLALASLLMRLLQIAQK